MKVILIKDVPKVGQRYDVKEFADGYARNALINKGLAIQASAAEISKIDAMKAKAKKEQEENNKAFEALIAKVGQTTITLKLKANDKGHLFSSISKKDVVNAIKESSGVTLEEDSIVFKNPIKETGSHKVNIKKGDREEECTIIVEGVNK